MSSVCSIKTISPTYLVTTNPQIPIQDLCHHPSELAHFIINLPHNHHSYSTSKILKFIATATFCHHVLLPHTLTSIQTILNKQSILQHLTNSQSKTVFLEAINIFCLIKGFSINVLNFQSPPQMQSEFQQALWANVMPIICKQKYQNPIYEHISKISEEATHQVKQFINEIYVLRQQVVKKLQNNNYYQDSILYAPSDLIHVLDIKIAQSTGLVTAEYLPDDYKAEYIQIWVDRTVQLNSLLGNFVCRERFGEFQYVKGPLSYTMEKGIMLVLNNFEQISNELLVGMRTLAEQMKIFHNQKSIEARGGFKILGLCSKQRLSAKMRAMVSQNKYITHVQLPPRSCLKQIPQITNQANREYLYQTLKRHEQKEGILSGQKLWKRIKRLRSLMMESEQEKTLWQTYFTQGFKDGVDLEISELLNNLDANRTIQYEEQYKRIRIGRTSLQIMGQSSQKIVKTQYSLSILERLTICSELGETPLLISQTGCGKTTLVQYLAQLAGNHLYVYNMSSGTDVMDLVGGFKPIDCRSLLKQLFYQFVQKFRSMPESNKNQAFLQGLVNLYQKDQLERLLKSLSASIIKIKPKISNERQLREWDELKTRFDNILANLDKIDSNLVFSFLQGNLVKAIKNGDWVLIDEINMATNDVLQKIVPLIEGKSLLLYEKGDLTYIERHPGFKIIACMNPANDSGKKPLPPNLMEKFTAINLMEPSRFDIELMVKQIAPQLSPSEIADIFFAVKKEKTVSLRNLSRCLAYLNRNKEIYSFKRALYDALVLGFQYKKILKQYEDLTQPKPIPNHTLMNGFLVEKGEHEHVGEPQVFHLTDTFLQHLRDFLRAIAGTELPVLLEGPTSAGKTSIIRYVASVSGHKCIRINNHEHTEVEEYLGNYFPDKEGKLVFREGPLVQAVKEGHWLILDELNLARTQILECLNRLLDDNRELFIPEQQKHIHPHKSFRIFATQNPSSYSGRKTLSRAFRNRFISLNFYDITVEDTMAIMKVRRPILADSKELAVYIKKVLQTLQNYRLRQKVMSKDSVITIRDLLKWTGRKFTDKQSFVRQGFALLGQRLRTEQQKNYVEKVLMTGLKNKEMEMSAQYERVVNQYLSHEVIHGQNIYVQMNRSFKRMAALTLKAVMNGEPVLLVGQTGCGKTTLAELLAGISGRKFYSINCHKHTQASDLLGSLRPCTKANSNQKFQYVNGVVIDAMLDGAVLLIDEINTAEDSVLERLNQVLQSGNIGVQRGEGWETVNAAQGFCIIATMNPSGDYGKKELSPALRNRFTEIWVQPITHPQFIIDAKNDITEMIQHKLSNSSDETITQNIQHISSLIFDFLQNYNCVLAPKYGLVRKLLTMRDIGWICKFMNESNTSGEEDIVLRGWEDKYYYGIRILAVEGVHYLMGDITESTKLEKLKVQLIEYICAQLGWDVSQIQNKDNNQLVVLSLVKELSFPLLIKTDLPLELLGIHPHQRIFFSPHTQLTDLLGQFRPQGTDFIWNDQTLLSTVKKGQRLALMDLNLAQQPVIEGINSLFDHRGSIFVVQLNQTFHKHQNFKPVVVLKETNTTDRKGLPNSFLNRFIKIRVKDVSTKTKINYLKNKYTRAGQIDELWSYIQQQLNRDGKIKIQGLQYLCQLSIAGQAYFYKGIQILGMPMPNKYNLNILPSEEEVTQLLPLNKQYKVQNVDILVNSHITLGKTSFSLCLVGDANTRDNMAAAIAYLSKKSITKVILSTMTDMADLLGSYEQVYQDSKEDDQQIAQLSISQIYQTINQQNRLSKEAQSQQSMATSFKYVQSRIMKTLAKPHSHLLYVEVPNEALLERVEKGIKQIFSQQVQVLVGLDKLQSTNNTKLIAMRLQNSEKVVQNSDYYMPNYSQLKHWDSKQRIGQTHEWISQEAGKQSERQIVKAYQRLYQFLYQLSNKSLDYNQQREEQKLYQTVYQQQCSKFGLSPSQDPRNIQSHLPQQYHQYINTVLQVSHSKQELQTKQFIMELFTKRNHRTLMVSEDSMENEQEAGNNIYRQNLTLPYKFQCIYMGDGEQTFKHQTDRLLQALYHRSGEMGSAMGILDKFKKEIEQMYRNSSSICNQEILIQFNESEYKVIPILDKPSRNRICYYALANIPSSINTLAGIIAHPSSLLHDLQASLYKYISYLSVNMNQSSQWLWNISVRDLPIYRILYQNLIQNNLDFYSSFSSNFTNTILADKFLSSILAQKNYHNQLQFAHTIYHLFKPSDNMAINLAFHVRTQVQMRTLQTLAKEDLCFRDVYRQLCQHKYGGYAPNSFKMIDERVEKYGEQLKKLRSKMYVYRGYDNIRILRQFYHELTLLCHKIEASEFNEDVLRQITVQLFDYKYSTFKDILWPLISAFCIIHAQKLKENRNQTVISEQLLKKSNKPFHKAIGLIMDKEEEEFHDAAKDYTKYQRKFNKTVIVDQYSQEGVKKNKQNDEEQFRQFFGKSNITDNNQDTIIDDLYILVRRRTGKYQLKLFKQMFTSCSSFDQLVVGLHLKYPSNTETNTINIYEQWDMSLVAELTSPIPKILSKVKTLLQKYNIDSMRTLGTLCNKIQEHKVHDQIYKVLADCEFLEDKIIQVNSILPSAERVDDADLVSQCLRMRRLQLKNWKSMLAYKVTRIERSDTIQFIHFYRNFIQICRIAQSEHLKAKQCFRMCDDFMRHSKMSCYDYRLSILTILADYVPNVEIKKNISRVIGFYRYLKEDIEEQWELIKTQKLKEMAEYEKLSSWSSNEYLIFKATCEKFQRKIHHILKRYEQELAIQVGVFHTTIRNKKLNNSLPDFITTHKIAQQAIPIFENNKYEGAVGKIFESLEDLKQEHHNNQSKMLIIRRDLADLEELIEDLPTLGSKTMQSQIICEEMFNNPQNFKKSMKYYYGMWDRLCQKTQTAWNQVIIERIWSVVQKIWCNINSRIPEQNFDISSEIDDRTQNLLILYEKFFSEDSSAKKHLIFEEELSKIKQILMYQQEQYDKRMNMKYIKIQNEEETVCLMKIGYIISCVALNLQKNGLCVKENEQNAEQSGTQEVGDGMGIGEGEAHQGAQNVGDQIQFEEQIQGQKGQQENKDQNANNKEENDIEMEGDFNGDMYSKEEQGEDEEGKSQEADQQMGSVDNEEREQDMKNQEGEAEGEGQADVDIEGQQEGQSQLVDNEKQQKQARKKQDKGEQDDQEGEEEQKSDWGDNNQQGDKINKQEKGDGEEEEEQEGSMNNQMDQQRQAESISGEEQGMDEEKEENDDADESGSEQDNEEKNQEEGSEEGNKQGDAFEIDQENNEQPVEEKEEKEKIKRTRKTKMEAYGRTDLNSDNPLKDNQDAQAQQKDQGGADAQGGTDGDKGAGDPVHSLSAQLLRQILNLERTQAEQNIMKDLNVVAHDDQNQQADQQQGEEERQQFELTQEDHKIGTNLPAFLEGEQEKQQQEKQKEKQKEQQEQKRKQTSKQKKQGKEEQKDEQKEKKTSKLDKLSDQKVEKAEQQPLPKNNKKENDAKKKTRDNSVQQKNVKRQTKEEPIKNEQMFRQIVGQNTKIQAERAIQIMEDEGDRQSILEEAYEVSKLLEEQLKSVLEPMDNAEYRGDYKTGKKLNLKKIIPFIASNYRKDRIWLRRTEPSQRNYYIMIALDDTKSMHHGEVGIEALKGTMAIATALHNLSIKTCITGIRDSMVIHKHFQGLLEPHKIINSFDFSHESQRSHDLSIASFMQASLDQFKKSQSSETGVQNKQLCFIISDGKMNKDYVRPYMKDARKKEIIYVFIIIDSEKSSILTTKSVSIGEDGKVKMQLYMSDFPFEYFLIVRNVRELGQILATTLMQFIQQK